MLHVCRLLGLWGFGDVSSVGQCSVDSCKPCNLLPAFLVFPALMAVEWPNPVQIDSALLSELP